MNHIIEQVKKNREEFDEKFSGELRMIASKNPQEIDRFVTEEIHAFLSSATIKVLEACVEEVGEDIKESVHLATDVILGETIVVTINRERQRIRQLLLSSIEEAKK